MIFFLQLAMVAVPKGYTVISGTVAAVVGQVVRMELPTSDKGSVCLVQGTTMVAQLVLRLFNPLMPMLVLMVVGQLLHF